MNTESNNNQNSFLTETSKGVTLTIKVCPNAGKNEVLDIHGNSLRLKIAAAPVKGKANKECLKLLAEVFNIKKSRVVLQRGEMSRSKQVLLEGAKREQVIEILKRRNII